MEEAFFNSPIIVVEDAKHSLHEPRFHLLGRTNNERKLHITFVLREIATKIYVRVISSRDMPPECDNYDFYLNAIDLETNVVVRLRVDRDIGTRSKPLLLTEKLKQTSAYKNKIIIKVPIEKLGEKDNSKATKYRNAELELKSIPITLAASRKQSQVIKENINLYAVEAKEINPPDGLEAAHWILITTLEINSYEESLMIVNCYSMRWKIENYFRVLKSGCTIEECRLGEAKRIIKYIALNSVIAWRIFWMTFVSRVSPENLVMWH